MFNTEYRLALVQVVYQLLFHQSKLPELKLDFIWPDQEGLDLVSLERDFSDIQLDLAANLDKITQLLHVGDTTYLIIQSLLLVFIFELNKLAKTGLDDQSKTILIKNYLKLGDKLLGGSGVNAVHAILLKL